MEISDTTLAIDQGVKLRSYARAGIVQYWIVTLVDRQVEVHTQPSGGTTLEYGQRQVYGVGTSVPVVLDGVLIGSVVVDELLP